MASFGESYSFPEEANPLEWGNKLAQGLGLAPEDQPTVGDFNSADPRVKFADSRNGEFQIDPITGQIIYAPAFATPGTNPIVQNPNVAQQVAQQSVRQQLAERRAEAYGARESDVFGKQTDLANYLNDVIAGKTPSVAELQLGRGLDSIRRQAVGIAGTATGANMPGAQLMALNAVGRAGAEANQQASINRAAESAQARGELAALLNAQEMSSKDLYGGERRQALDYGDMALRGQSALQGLTLEGDKAQGKGAAAVFKGAGEAIGF